MIRNITRWLPLAAALGACTTDDAAKFVGSWAYESGSTVQVDCGSGPSSIPFDTIVETFAESGGKLVKADNQGCVGLAFVAHGDVASLAAAGESCTIPASGSTPSAVFAPASYTFTLNESGTALAESLTASYTPDGSPSACAVTATNVLARK